MAAAAAATTGGPTPRTPEILNSLMSMTSPLEVAMRGVGAEAACAEGCVPPLQQTRSQLIREGLKLTLQTKRRTLLTPSPPLDYLPLTPGNEALTPEDEERRRRRRERNKIAATKCRLKKRERTFNLQHESEVLETQNMDLKSQIQDLENEKRRLVDMLSGHRPSCAKAGFESYGQVEISCETTISYREGWRETWPRDWNQPHYYYQDGYGRPPSLSTSSSDSLKEHDLQYQEQDYSPMYTAPALTHS